MIWITSLITWLQGLTTALEPLSAPLIKWVNDNLAENEALHQMRVAKRFCRHNKITTMPCILTVVKMCFPLQTAEMQTNISEVLFVELQ